MLQHLVLVTNIFSEVNVWQTVFGSLLYLLAIRTRHLQRKTNRRILLPSLRAASQLQGLGSALNIKLFVAEIFLMHSQLQKHLMPPSKALMEKKNGDKRKI